MNPLSERFGNWLRLHSISKHIRMATSIYSNTCSDKLENNWRQYISKRYQRVRNWVIRQHVYNGCFYLFSNNF